MLKECYALVSLIKIVLAIGYYRTVLISIISGFDISVTKKNGALIYVDAILCIKVVVM